MRGRLVSYLLSRIRDFGIFSVFGRPMMSAECKLRNVRIASQLFISKRKQRGCTEHIMCRVSLTLRRLFGPCFTAIYSTSPYVVPRGGIFLVHIHGVHCAGLSDFSVGGAAQQHSYRQVAQLFRRKFRR
jgi:hypothetical protein